ncbi:MAG TPA: SIS domain-containing protein [Candidatus Fournierella merdigallinarum]|nr:SIS domain-containing protein [Candidatus Fournierella merdigallinarum]
MADYARQYLEVVSGMMERVLQTQAAALDRAAELMADCICRRKNVFAFGPSHAGMFAEEFFYRAGGLAVVNPLFHAGMMLNTRPVTATSTIECLPGYARVILEESPLEAGDLLLIHSVAARNPVVVEMALLAREKGIQTVGVVNLDYAEQVTSRDPSGRRMQEVCDVVIDTCGCYGDACIQMEGMRQKVAPASTPISTFIANVLQIKTCQRLLERGEEPPVFCSANVDGGKEYNAELLRRWASQIHYMQ